jgi:hypothetical protein
MTVQMAETRRATARTKSRVAGPIPTSASRGMSAGPATASARTASQASPSPPTAAPPARTSDSEKNSAITRARPAPSASRTAISRRRWSARTRIRLATLAQATSSTSPAAAATIQSVLAIPPVTSWSIGTSTGRGLAWSSRSWVGTPGAMNGNNSSILGSTARNSRSASAGVTPSLSRAKPL